MDDTFGNDVDHPDDLDEEEEDVDGIRRAPSYPYHPCPAPSKSNKQEDPHQKYHHYNSYNHQQPSQKQTRFRNGFRSSDSSKENPRRNNILPNNSKLPSQQKKQRNVPKEGNYAPSQKTTEKLAAVTRRRESRQTDARNMTRRRQMRNSDRNHKPRPKDFIRSPYHEGGGEDTKRLLKEQNSALIKNHTKLMDQIMDDLIAEATDNEGQYYLDLAGNVRRVCIVYSYLGSKSAFHKVAMYF